MTHAPQGDDDRDQVRPVSPPPVPPAAIGWGQQDPAHSYRPPGQQYGPPPGTPYGQPEPEFGPPSGYGPPPYGQPPYGPPPYGQLPYGWAPAAVVAPRPRRWRVVLLGLLGVVLLASAVVVLTTALRSTALDPQAVQRDVARQFEQQSGTSVDLRCRDTMTVVPGRTYGCSGTTAEGASVTITLTITDENANYTWSEG
ncbi:MAG: uncharacterized protein JWP46_1614 [Modestobacter sp.]|nr:uncharacterized protein [Modestobacter sp.]